MFILVDKINGEIKSQSVGEIVFDADIFDLVEVPDEDLSGKKCKYKDGEIISEDITTKSKITKEDIDNAKTIDELKSIIKDLIK